MTRGAIKKGKSEEDAVAEAKASKLGHARSQTARRSGADSNSRLADHGSGERAHRAGGVLRLSVPVLRQGGGEDQRRTQGVPERRPPDLQTVSAGIASAGVHLRGGRAGRASIRENSGRCTISCSPTAHKLSRPNILEWAGKIGLDMKRFNADLDSDAIKKAVHPRYPGWRQGRRGRHAYRVYRRPAL